MTDMNFFPALVLSDARLRSISEDKLSVKASIANYDTKNLNIKRVPVELVKCTKEMLKNFRGNFYDYPDETFETSESDLSVSIYRARASSDQV